MPFGIGPVELIIVLVIALLVLGPGKLPDVGAALGKSIREFRKAATEVEEATKLEAKPAVTAPGPAATPTPSASPTGPVPAVTPAAAAPAAAAPGADAPTEPQA